MSKYFLYPNEWWPVLELRKPDPKDPEGDERVYGHSGEFTEEEIAEIRRCSAEFNRLQRLVADRCLPPKEYVEERELVDDD